MPNIMEILFGEPGGNKQVSTLTGGQGQGLEQILQLMQQLGGSGGGLQQAMQLLQGYLDPNSEQFKNFEAQHMQNFNQQTVPRLAERFAGMGGGMGGGLSSSGFGQALGAAGANLQTDLAAMKSGLGLQSAQGLFNQYNQMSNTGLGTRAFENQYSPGSTGLIGPAMTAAATAVGGPVLGAFGGYAGDTASKWLRG